MLALFNPKIKGIFVDSPNIRLEMESPNRMQRGRYLIDFSQMDIEVRRSRGIELDAYLHQTEKVEKTLREDHEQALGFFERLIVAATTAVADTNEENPKALGVALEVPEPPFPRFQRDEAVARLGTKTIVASRLIDNKIIDVAPQINGDNIENIGELGGMGVERCLFALCLGEKIYQVDQVTLFGKNPDSYPLYLF